MDLNKKRNIAGSTFSQQIRLKGLDGVTYPVFIILPDWVTRSIRFMARDWFTDTPAGMFLAIGRVRCRR